MTTVSLVTANTPLITAPVTSAAITSPTTSPVTAVQTPASVVMLGQDVPVSTVTTYTSLGSLTNAKATYSLEVDLRDAVTQTLTGNMSAANTSGRFQGLGAALLEQLANDGSSFSQSIIRSPAGEVKNAAALKSTQDQLHSNAENTITLTLKTASGATITLNLSNQANGLAVQADVSGGKLTDAERTGLAALASSFQGAVDGLTAEPPRLNLGSLAELDPSLFSSVDLSARLKLGEDKFQTLSFKADELGKSVDMTGPAGNVQMNVKNNSAILGTAQQQAQAVESYLNQFDAAQSRGEGDKELMTLFKDVFSALQSNVKSLNAAGSTSLSPVDRSMLTGLADFNASLTQTSSYPNPMRPGEVDKFSYNVAQNTTTKGTTDANRSVEQSQIANLSASYHKSLYPGSTLALTSESESQNYKYYQIKDEASSTARIGYDKGKLIEASFTQTARQSTTVMTYELGKLIDTVTTPREVGKFRDMLGVIEQALRDDRESRSTTGKSTLEDDLMSVHAKGLLQSDPSSISY